MFTVDADNAKAQFSQLLEKALRGERITITRHGLPVAVLGPVEPVGTLSVDEAIGELRAMRRGLTLGQPLVELIREGRR